MIGHRKKREHERRKDDLLFLLILLFYRAIPISSFVGAEPEIPDEERER